MSSKSNGINNRGFSNVLDGGFTIYQGGGGSSFNQDFRHRSSGSLNGTQGPNGLDKDYSQYANASDFNSLKDNNKTETETDPSEEGNKGIVHLLDVYAEKCSLNGVIFIKSSKYLVVKAIWTLLLVTAICIMVIHLYMLGSTYYSYEKQSKVDLKFENLKFPAVTFCNVNPMKYSKVHMAHPDLQKLIYDVDPMEMYNYVEEWEPSYEEETYHFDEDGEYIQWSDTSWDEFYWETEDNWDWSEGSSEGSAMTSKRRKKRSTGEFEDDYFWDETTSNITVMSRTNGFFDDYDYNWTNYDNMWENEFTEDTYSGSWESESEPSTFEQLATQFINFYNQENGTTRQEMGHRIQDMLIQCAFVGRKCVQSNFTMVASSTMGNCYTIQYDKFIARKSGSREGLTLMLYLETDEYIPGITNAKGAKLVVHEPGTVPFPDDEGLAVGAGMETSIGLRRTSITRLGKPWGECTDTSAFRFKYGIKYTRQACQEICEMEEVLKHCQCYDAVKPFIYTLMRSRRDLMTCQQHPDKMKMHCMADIEWTFQTNSSCHCSSPCKEVTYKKTISSKPWPSPSFAKLMAKSVCQEKPTSPLCDYPMMDDTTLKDNFVKINVYFETLNFESVSEEPDYTEFQFMSDVGGTVGLYIGISALSAFELLHLFISIVRHLICRQKYRNNGNNGNNGNTVNT